MKVAIVCDWLTNIGGAERVLKSISEMYPEAPIYTSQYNPRKIKWFKDNEVRVGWLQNFPSSFRRFLGPLRQIYFNHLDLKEYDLIISVTGAEAKSIKKKGNTIHISYCHVPTQYYWGLYDSYVENPGFGVLDPIVRFFFKALVKPLRNADFKAAQRPDYFVTISTYASEQIKKYYKRESTIVFPPVAVENFYTRELSTSKNPEQNIIKTKKSQVQEKDNKKLKNVKSQINTVESMDATLKSHNREGYITTSRHVTWKRLDLAIKACMSLNLPLTIIGEGPETKKLKKLANGSKLIKFLPVMNQKSLKNHLESSKGFIFPSLEPFGIAPVEALASGCPVIAYGKGGALDYISDGKNGVLFEDQTVDSLCDALKRFEKLSFNEEKVRNSALPFSEECFKAKLDQVIKKALKEKHHETNKKQ